MNTKNFGIVFLGGLVGGVLGYVLGELVVEKILAKGAENVEFIETSIEEGLSDMLKEIGTDEADRRHLDYTKFAKADLEMLVKPYTASNDETEEKIKIISLDEFTKSGLPKEIILYFETDTTFSTEQEAIIENPADLFGPNIHLHFGELSEDDDIVYVRNENNGVEYEITRLRQSYSVVVMGLPEQPVKPKRRRKKTNDKDEDESEE